jgi:hypothetical protein
MSSPDWKDLERLWQSCEAGSADDIIARQRRRRWLSWLNMMGEFGVTIAGLGGSVWLMTLDRPYALFTGGVVLAFTLFALMAALWARLPRHAAREESVMAAIDAAIDRARASVRYGLACFWIVVAALGVLAVTAFVWAAAVDNPPGVPPRALFYLGVMIAWTATGQAFTLVYYFRRSAELARLEEIKRSIAAE